MYKQYALSKTDHHATPRRIRTHVRRRRPPLSTAARRRREQRGTDTALRPPQRRQQRRGGPILTMTVEIPEHTSGRQVRAAERLHEFVVNELRMSTENVLVRVHADGTITVQLAASIGHGTEPEVKTLSLPRGHCGFLGSYDGAPGLSLDLHRDYVDETDDASIRRDALTILEELTPGPSTVN